MSLLSFTRPDGIHFEFDALTGKWTAQKEGHRPSSSQSLGTLNDRVEKWIAPPTGKKVSPVAPASEMFTVGLAGVARDHSPSMEGFYGAPALPSMKIKLANAKLAWQEGDVQLVRYQTGGTDTKESWQSAHMPFYFLNPSVFTDEDRQTWDAVAIAHTAATLLVQGHRKLAEAWDKLNPVDSKIYRMREIRDRDSHKPIEYLLEPVARVGTSENREFVSISPRWPVIKAIAPTTTLAPDEFNDWVSDNGRLRHPSGVEVALVSVGAMSPSFQVSRPDPKGGSRQALYESSEFADVFRLGRATAELAGMKVSPVVEWKGSGDWLDRGVSWPKKVETEAVAIFATNERHRTSSLPTPFVLQTDESKPVGHPQWRQNLRQPSTTYRPTSPADTMLAQRDALAQAFEALIGPLRPTLAQVYTRLKDMHTAALREAHQVAQEEEAPETPEQAQARLDRYFKRVLSQASVTVMASDLAKVVEGLDLNPAVSPPSRRSARP